MQAEFINPFINSAMNVVSTMCAFNPIPGAPSLKEGGKTWGDVTGIIGLAGASVMGNMMVSFNEKGVLYIVSKMLMEEYREINQDVFDAVGEITNIITGGAKKEFSEMGISIEMALPMVVSGKGVEINQLAASPIISIPFSFPEGAFVVEANLVNRNGNLT
jgi:chemotaxis protein CheX